MPSVKKVITYYSACQGERYYEADVPIVIVPMFLAHTLNILVVLLDKWKDIVILKSLIEE
jgi:hypothetical protein